MKIIFITLSILALSACSFRGWDPPNYDQSLCAPANVGNTNPCPMPHIPLVQMNETKV